MTVDTPAQPDEQITTAVVTELPDCDVHLRLFDVHVLAAYDVATTLPGRPWAYLCEKCFPRFSAGELGLGVGQRLILVSGDEP